MGIFMGITGCQKYESPGVKGIDSRARIWKTLREFERQDMVMFGSEVEMSTEHI